MDILLSLMIAFGVFNKNFNLSKLSCLPQWQAREQHFKYSFLSFLHLSRCGTLLKRTFNNLHMLCVYVWKFDYWLACENLSPYEIKVGSILYNFETNF